MCGIAGLLGENINPKVIDKMLEIQKHIGPDNASKWNDDSICLGHNRMSIIDLSEEANQPFFSNDKLSFCLLKTICLKSLIFIFSHFVSFSTK